MPNPNQLADYYAKRASEYEAIYAKPERQADLKALALLLQDIFKGKQVVEIACGTGYWTKEIAQTAQQIFATDINDAVLEIARSKAYARNNVTFMQADLYEIQPDQPAESLFGGFIWSHISVESLGHFLEKVHSLVIPGGWLVFVDNRYVEGSSTPIAEKDPQGNTFQKRSLQDGTTHLVLKNFPEKGDLEGILAGKARNLKFIALDYFWVCLYQTLGS